MQLGLAGNENHFCAAMFQDVSHPVGRLVEIHRYGDATSAGDGEVGSMPLRTVCGEKAEAVARLYTEFHKRCRKAGDAAEKLLGRDGLPPAVAAESNTVKIDGGFGVLHD